jgi:hypothetical protein
MKKENPDMANLELPSNERRINELLENAAVKHELLETFEIATYCRRDNDYFKNLLAEYVSSGILSGTSPQFKNVAGFQSALYARERKVMYVDTWNISHSEIARKNDLQARDGWGHQVSETGCYTGGDIFVFEQAKGLRTVLIDSLFGFFAEDLESIKNLGYLVLSPKRNWLFEEPGEARVKTLTSIPSPISLGPDFVKQ